jgi:hypothetical protein
LSWRGQANVVFVVEAACIVEESKLTWSSGRARVRDRGPNTLSSRAKRVLDGAGRTIVASMGCEDKTRRFETRKGENVLHTVAQ